MEDSSFTPWMQLFVKAPMAAAMPGFGLVIASQQGFEWFWGALALSALFFALAGATRSFLKDRAWYRTYLIQHFLVSVALGAPCIYSPLAMIAALFLWPVAAFVMFSMYRDRMGPWTNTLADNEYESRRPPG